MQLDSGLCGGVLQWATLQCFHLGFAKSALLAEGWPPHASSERRLHLWKCDCPSNTLASPTPKATQPSTSTTVTANATDAIASREIAVLAPIVLWWYDSPEWSVHRDLGAWSKSK
jgi:hypothetical protein